MWGVVARFLGGLLRKVFSWGWVQFLVADSAKKTVVFAVSALAFYSAFRLFTSRWQVETIGLPDIPGEWKPSLEESLAAANAWLPVAEVWAIVKLYMLLYLSALATRFSLRLVEHGRSRG